MNYRAAMRRARELAALSPDQQSAPITRRIYRNPRFQWAWMDPDVGTGMGTRYGWGLPYWEAGAVAASLELDGMRVTKRKFGVDWNPDAKPKRRRKIPKSWSRVCVGTCKFCFD